MDKEKKAEKKAKKAEKKANRNPEVIKAIISSVTAVACVVAVVVTSLSITDKVCETNQTIAEGSGSSSASNNAAGEDPFSDFGGEDDNGSTDNGSTDSGITDNGSTDSGITDNGSSSGSSSSSGNNSSGNNSSGNNSSGNNSSSSSVPVGTDISKIVSYYNKAANDTKAYKGTMKLDITQGATTKITETSFPKAAMNIANKMLPNDYPTKKNYTVSNGKAGDKDISKILPIEGNAKMSTLAASGVASASCVKGNGGYKVVIKLKPESVNSFSKQPVNHASCMACLDMSDEDLKPFVCENCNINYQGGTITAIINEKGLLTGFDAYNPMHITGTLSWTAIKGTATIDASWRRTVKFAY